MISSPTCSSPSEPTRSSSQSRLTASRPFPSVLYEVLGKAEYDQKYRSVLSWEPHGRSFVIYNRERFSNDIMPLHFAYQTHFASFQRQLNLYGFRRISPRGSESVMYFHPDFIKGHKELCRTIQRSYNSRQNMKKHFRARREGSYPDLQLSTQRTLSQRENSSPPWSPTAERLPTRTTSSHSQSSTGAEDHFIDRLTTELRVSSEGNSSDNVLNEISLPFIPQGVQERHVSPLVENRKENSTMMQPTQMTTFAPTGQVCGDVTPPSCADQSFSAITLTLFNHNQRIHCNSMFLPHVSPDKSPKATISQNATSQDLTTSLSKALDYAITRFTALPLSMGRGEFPLMSRNDEEKEGCHLFLGTDFERNGTEGNIPCFRDPLTEDSIPLNLQNCGRDRWNEERRSKDLSAISPSSSGSNLSSSSFLPTCIMNKDSNKGVETSDTPHLTEKNYMERYPLNWSVQDNANSGIIRKKETVEEDMKEGRIAVDSNMKLTGLQPEGEIGVTMRKLLTSSSVTGLKRKASNTSVIRGTRICFQARKENQEHTECSSDPLPWIIDELEEVDEDMVAFLDDVDLEEDDCEPLRQRVELVDF